MSGSGNLRSWMSFIGSRNPDDAASEVIRLAHRLDDALDAVNHVLKNVAGCPSQDTEELLRVARLSVDEATDNLHNVAAALQRSSPDAA